MRPTTTFYVHNCDMPLSEYLALLSELALKLQRLQKLWCTIWHLTRNLVLEELHALEERYTAIIQCAAAKGDEDTAADFGNDLTRLHILRESFERKPLKLSAPTSLSCQINLSRRWPSRTANTSHDRAEKIHPPPQSRKG
jgi:hypothetical protein